LNLELQSSGYITEIRTLEGVTHGKNIEYSSQTSNLNALLEGIQNDYEARNLATVVLFSDGLYNSGSNPSFRPYNFNISAVGLGDTIQHPDINLNALLYNKIVYQGNSFPIIAEVFSYNLSGKTVNIQLLKNRQTIQSKTITIKSDNQYEQVQFLVSADESGMQRYSIVTSTDQPEHIMSNNAKDAYVDVIDGKQKILLVSPAPHPDIKAIKNALESNKNYELVVHIEGMFPYVEDKYDAVILHQVPNRRRQYQELLAKISRDKIPAFFIYGSQSDLNAFNTMNGCVTILPLNAQSDNVFPHFNQVFNSFMFTRENLDALDAFSPVKVPFANFTLSGAAEVMLKQKIGKIVTEKPLLVVQRSNDWSSAAIIGDGMWNWRIQEFAKTQDTKAFDEIITKLIQYLSTLEDKRKFRVYPIKNEFLNNEPVVFESEVYNSIYEQTYNHTIDISIANENASKQDFTYVTSSQNSSYRISGLDEGVYSYSASATIDNKKETVVGSFMVKDLQIESTNLTADHHLLRNIASQHQGNFYNVNEISRLKSELLSREPADKIYSTEKYLAIIQLPWAFFILIVFISAEWFLRKYHGAY